MTPRTFRLSKSKITAGLQCGRRLWLSVHRPWLAVYSAETQRRFAAGTGVGELARELYGEGVLIRGGGNLSKAVRDTQAVLSLPGDVTLYEATFRHRDVLVRVDVLQRRGGRYRMVEIKSATRVKEYHLQDVAIQTWVVEGAGVPLHELYVAVIDTEYVYRGEGYAGLLREVPVADQARPLTACLPGWVRGFGELLAGPRPVREVGPHCRSPFECPFIGFCTGRDGRRAALVASGSDQEGAVGSASPADLVVTPPADPAAGTVDPAASVYLSALAYPRFYLDFEAAQFAVPPWPGTRPYQQVVFQWSCHVERAPGELEHREFLEASGSSPLRSAAEALIEALGEEGPIFVYHDFEKWRLFEMARALPDLAPQLEALAGRLIDLLRLTRQHYRHPALGGSFSLKTVLSTIDPELTYAALAEVRDGLSAQAAYHEVVDPNTTLERREELRSALLRYCALDTLALVRVVGRLSGG